MAADEEREREAGAPVEKRLEGDSARRAKPPQAAGRPTADALGGWSFPTSAIGVGSEARARSDYLEQ